MTPIVSTFRAPSVRIPAHTGTYGPYRLHVSPGNPQVSPVSRNARAFRRGLRRELAQNEGAYRRLKIRGHGHALGAVEYVPRHPLCAVEYVPQPDLLVSSNPPLHPVALRLG